MICGASCARLGAASRESGLEFFASLILWLTNTPISLDSTCLVVCLLQPREEAL